jgi:hypothetical protein
MKSSLITLALLLNAGAEFSQAVASDASTSPDSNLAAELPAPTPWAVVDRGPHHKTWERIVYELSPSGSAVPVSHRYTELATGMNYLQNNQWVDASEEIDILPQGGAAAVHGQHQVYFPTDIYAGAVQLVTPDGKNLQFRPLGLSYFDGNNSVLIAELTNSVGQLLPSKREVIYPDAFSDLAVDLRCVYTRAGYEENIVLKERPPDPQDFGLNPATTRIQVLTEWFSPPQPQVCQFVA